MTSRIVVMAIPMLTTHVTWTAIVVQAPSFPLFSKVKNIEMAGRRTGTPKTGGRKAGTPNKRTVALRTATATAAEQISATLGSEVFHGDAHALLMTVYKDLKQPIGLRMEAAKAALPYEKPRLASIENKIVDEFDNMSDQEIEAWLDEQAERRVKVRHRASAEVHRRGGIWTLRPTRAQGKPH
jgi:hypothetical protein